jgi:4-amino-4-deoxy-L-arabinose transferase-like glycosyltransferase
MEVRLLRSFEIRFAPTMPTLESIPAIPYLLLGFFLIAWAIGRLLLWKSIEFDEAEQLYFAQVLSAGYSAQPPLYTWILWCIVQIVGVNVGSLIVLQIGILTAQCALMFAISKRFLSNHITRWLAVFASLLLVPVFGWEVTRQLTHTSLMSVISLLTVWVVLRIREEEDLRDYALLGICFALGMLSKYNYVLVLLALCVSGWTVDSFRRCMLTTKMLLAFGIAGLLLLPHLNWLIHHWSEVLNYTSGIAKMDSQTSWAKGIFQWGIAILHGVGLLALCWWLLFRHHWSKQISRKSDNQRWLERLLLIGFGCYLILVLLGAKNIRAHWFGPFLLLFPIWQFTQLRRLSIPPRKYYWYTGILLVGAMSMLTLRVARVAIGWEDGKYQTRDYLYDLIAKQVDSSGIRLSRIVVDDPVIAGYQRLHFPQIPVDCLQYPSLPIDSKDHLSLLLVWDATWTEKPSPDFLDQLHLKYSIACNPIPIPTIFHHPESVWRSSTKRLGMVLVNTE